MFASEKGNSSVVKILLKYGARVSLVEDGGFTALHLSPQHGHPTVTRLLAAAGASLEAVNKRHCTPLLHLAAQRGQWK